MATNQVDQEPLSGGITQTINLMQFWLQSSLPAIFAQMQQQGFINLNNLASSDTEVEERITREVAGYGKQLGRLVDAVALILEILEERRLLEGLAEEDLMELEQLTAMKNEIDEVKRKYGKKPVAASRQRLSDRERNQLIEEIIRKLRAQ